MTEPGFLEGLEPEVLRQLYVGELERSVATAESTLAELRGANVGQDLRAMTAEVREQMEVVNALGAEVRRRILDGSLDARDAPAPAPRRRWWRAWLGR